MSSHISFKARIHHTVQPTYLVDSSLESFIRSSDKIAPLLTNHNSSSAPNNLHAVPLHVELTYLSG
jgi:hypothetical protein